MSEDTSRLDRRSVAVGFVLLACLFAVSAAGLVVAETTPKCEFVKAILCAEFPVDGAQFAQVLSPAVNALAGWEQTVWFDMPFLVLYAALLILGIRCVARDRRTGRAAGLGPAIGLTGIGALFDVAENIAILMAIETVGGGLVPSDELAIMTTMMARAKFTVLFCACLWIGTNAWRASYATWVRVLYAAAGLTAISGLAGLFVPKMWEIGAAGIALTCLLLFIHPLVREITKWRATKQKLPS